MYVEGARGEGGGGRELAPADQLQRGLFFFFDMIHYENEKKNPFFYLFFLVGFFHSFSPQYTSYNNITGGERVCSHIISAYTTAESKNKWKNEWIHLTSENWWLWQVPACEGHIQSFHECQGAHRQTVVDLGRERKRCAGHIIRVPEAWRRFLTVSLLGRFWDRNSTSTVVPDSKGLFGTHTVIWAVRYHISKFDHDLGKLHSLCEYLGLWNSYFISYP